MKTLKLITVVLLAFAFTNIMAVNDDKKESANKVELKPTLIKGTIKDAITGELLAGVAIKLQGSEKTYYTDFDGNFQIKDIKPGEYTITCSYISYKTAKKDKIAIKENETKTLKLSLNTL